MNDFIGDNQCVTHHYACDCREAHFRSLEAENKRLKAVLTKIAGRKNIDSFAASAIAKAAIKKAGE